MLNNYSSNNNNNYTSNLKINACPGGIYKTYKESWFKRFNLKSELAETLFKPYDSKLKVGEITHTYDGDWRTTKTNIIEEVITLQMIICGDMEVIAELIKQEDFNKYFNENTIKDK